MRYARELESRGEHLRICHAEEFIDIDCGCGHSYSIKALACIRLDDMVEYYMIEKNSREKYEKRVTQNDFRAGCRVSLSLYIN